MSGCGITNNPMAEEDILCWSLFDQYEPVLRKCDLLVSTMLSIFPSLMDHQEGMYSSTLLALEGWSWCRSIEIIYYHSLLSTKIEFYNDEQTEKLVLKGSIVKTTSKLERWVFLEYEKRYPVI